MYERLLNKQIVPAMDDLTAHCGECGAMFVHLNEHLTKNYGTSQEIRFPYGNSYGWGVAHRKGKQLVCNVFAEADAFTVMLRMSDRQFASVRDLLSDYTRHIIDNKYPCGDGGWIHYRVVNGEHLEDIQRLLAVKCAKWRAATEEMP